MLVTRVERIEVAAPSAGDRWRILSYDLEATVRGPIEPRHGMVVNIVDMKDRLRQDVVAKLSGRLLDGSSGGGPSWRTPEELARGIFELLRGEVAGRPLIRIRLAGGSSIVECHEDRAVDVTRIYEFSASHRLHSAWLTDEENVRLFGKCNNPHGHGHNYVLEVTVRGEPGDSGELVPAEAFDRIVRGAVVDRWDHKNLNLDLPEFAGVNPTAEEITRIAWRELQPRFQAEGIRIYRVKLRETGRNHVEYFGD
jgi:6-pyruvoyltetrahydropterin/6-carboxytetrahydropterin synthase